MNEPEESTALLEALAPLSPKLVIVDTLARCSSGDENSVQDMMSLIRNCDRVRHETGAAVLIVHHTGVNESRERGSTALRASCDAMFSLSPADDLLKLTCEKQKDDEPFSDLQLAIVPVQETESCAVRLAECGRSGKLSQSQSRALEVLDQNFPSSGATTNAWLTATQLRERTFYRSQKVLIEAGYVRQDQGKNIRTDKAAVA
jgi:hypothetical protein